MQWQPIDTAPRDGRMTDEEKIAKLWNGLQSIMYNKCCHCCGEAALVAKETMLSICED